jgi:hypothetical protein
MKIRQWGFAGLLALVALSGMGVDCIRVTNEGLAEEADRVKKEEAAKKTPPADQKVPPRAVTTPAPTGPSQPTAPTPLAPALPAPATP